MAPPSASGVPPTSSALSRPYSPSPPPPPANYVPSPAHPPSGAPPAAPPPPPPGAPAHPSPQHVTVGHPAVDAAPVTRKSTMMGMIPMSDARSDLLAAIRRGKYVVTIEPDEVLLNTVWCSLMLIRVLLKWSHTVVRRQNVDWFCP